MLVFVSTLFSVFNTRGSSGPEKTQRSKHHEPSHMCVLENNLLIVKNNYVLSPIAGVTAIMWVIADLFSCSGLWSHAEPSSAGGMLM